jgi:hypothetical protein
LAWIENTALRSFYLIHSVSASFTVLMAIGAV